MQLIVHGRPFTNQRPQLLHPPIGLMDQPIRLKEPKPDWLQADHERNHRHLAPIYFWQVVRYSCCWTALGCCRFRRPRPGNLDTNQPASRSNAAQYPANCPAYARPTNNCCAYKNSPSKKRLKICMTMSYPRLSLVQMRLLTANQLIDTQPEKAHTDTSREPGKLARRTVNLYAAYKKIWSFAHLNMACLPICSEMVDQFDHDMGITTDLQFTAHHLIVSSLIPAFEKPYMPSGSKHWTIFIQHAQATQVTINVELDIRPTHLHHLR